MNAVLPPASPRGRGPGRAQFLLLAALFFTPFAAAWILFFYFPQNRPSGTTNYGQLVAPVKQLPENWDWRQPDGQPAGTRTLRGKWVLLQIVAADCDQACADRVLLTRQLRTALNADRGRVQRVMLGGDAAQVAALQTRLVIQHPDLLWRAASNIDEVKTFFSANDPQAIYLIDPLGNYLMVYTSGHGIQSDFKGMQKDIHKLLQLSSIG